jgi:hypothetical protein
MVNRSRVNNSRNKNKLVILAIAATLLTTGLVILPTTLAAGDESFWGYNTEQNQWTSHIN